MEAFVVGGAVRDFIMGVPYKDRDWVVTGATEADMLGMGFHKVGKDFPTFLHPESKEEYSLARRERKGGVTSFGLDVKLKEDLSKRDLTINAMVMNDDERVADFYGGREDIKNKVLRMVSFESFVEDPIRVLRVARFAARYPDFTVERETMKTMRMLVTTGALNGATPERVWKELEKGLMEKKPSRMLQVLRQCGALHVILPEVDALYGVPQPVQWHPEVDTGIHVEQVIDYAASQNFDLPVRFACLLHDVGKALSPQATWPAHHGHEGDGVPLVEVACWRLNVPSKLARVAVMTAREHGNIHSAMKVKTTTIVKVLRRCDAFRNPELFQYVLQASLCDSRGRVGDTVSFADREYPQAERFAAALWAAKQVKGGEVAEKYPGRPELIQVAMHAARARAIKQFENKQKQAA